jgi:integrase
MKLNEETLKALPAPERGNRIHYFPDAVIQGQRAPRGFGVRVTAGGAKSFVLNYRVKRRECRITLGRWPDWSCVRAVRAAREMRIRIDQGVDPLEDRKAAPGTSTVAAALAQFVTEYARPRLRSAAEYEVAFTRLVVPAIGRIELRELRRSDITGMLNRIAKDHGEVMADRTLAYCRKGLRWFAVNGGEAVPEDFIPPFLPGMGRTSTAERARTRILADDEIRRLWPALGALGTIGNLAKMLLLTAQRRDEVAGMRRTEIGSDGWEIPRERYKTKQPHYVPLSAPAIAIVNAQPTNGDYVFTGRSGKPFSSFGHAKEAIDAAVPLSPRWTLHDLRRTARSLMSRAGITSDIAERVLGHTIPGVRGTYDRHDYLIEKRDALGRLATMIEGIVS